MHALAAVAALVLASEPAGAPSSPTSVTIELERAPLSVAATPRPDGAVDVYLAIGADVDRFRLQGRTLTPAGRFRAPVKGARPLRVEGSPGAGASAPRLAAILGEDVQSTDQGTDTRLHAFVLVAPPDGGLAAEGGDHRGWVRFVGGAAFTQARGLHAPFEGPVRSLGGEGPAVPWAGRSILEATPLPGDAQALAFDGDRPVVVSRADGQRVAGAGLGSELGEVGFPTIRVRLEQPIAGIGPDRFGREFDRKLPVPRRVLVGEGGAAFTLERGRRKGPFSKASGQDAVVRLDWKAGELTLSRPYPGVDGFVVDFAVVSRAEGAPLAVLLANEKEDGTGRAYLVVQEPR